MTSAPMVRVWLDWRVWGMWVLGETWHAPQTSLLTQFRVGSRGVWVRLPACKARNSWRWVLWRLGPTHCVHAVRWTLPRRTP